MIRKLVATAAIAGSLALAVACDGLPIGGSPITMPDDIKHPDVIADAYLPILGEGQKAPEGKCQKYPQILAGRMRPGW